jgi:D-glycero-alpha-D-manno-heptose-7-phosphate kinase
MKIRARAPLRLGLAGGGTDVSPFCDEHGGNVMNVTISMYAHVTLEDRDDSKVLFRSLDLDQSELWDTAAARQQSGLALMKGVYFGMMDRFNSGALLPMDITTSSDAPAGSGLGASSTIVVALITALANRMGLPLNEYEVAQLAYDIERVDLQLLGGRQDQYAAAFGGFNFMEFGANSTAVISPLRIKDWVVFELEASIVLYYTGQSRESANIISAQVENMRHPPSGEILEALLGLKKEASEVRECLLKGQLDRLADSMRRGWEQKKKTAKNISSEAIETAQQVAMQAGAYACKVSGAGGGGFMIFFVDPDHKPNLIRQLETLPGKIFTCHFTHHGAQAWRMSATGVSA